MLREFVSFPCFVEGNGELTDHRDEEGNGVCGLGPDFCGIIPKSQISLERHANYISGDGCYSSCDYKSECDPGWGMEWSNASTCPLNVCCSDFGFCGTTADFCNGKTVTSPWCPGGTSANEKVIGYYEGWVSVEI